MRAESGTGREEEGSSTKWDAGYYLALAVFIAAIGGSVYFMKRRKTPKKSADITLFRPVRYCTRCGSPNDILNKNCGDCGYEIPAAQESAAMIKEPLIITPADSAANIPENCGDSTLVLNPGGAWDMSDKQNPPVLKIERDGFKEIIPIYKPEFLIGRNQPAVDYCEASSNHIGRVHAKIVTRDAAYFLVDLDSKNGTFINGSRINSGELIPLIYQDKVRLANVEFIFDEA